MMTYLLMKKKIFVKPVLQNIRPFENEFGDDQ